MKISVITPYKDAAKYLPRCLDSLQKQDGDFEFIFVDDHSEDEGASIVNDRAERDSRIITASVNVFHGVSSARNRGLELASGDWVTFLDADDELLPGAWEKYMQMIDAAEGAKILQANHIRHIVRTRATVRKYENPSGLYELPALPEMWAPVWNKLYKRQVLKGIEFDMFMDFGEDEIFNVECLEKAGGIRNTAIDIMQHDLENPQSLSRTKDDKDLARLLQALSQRLVLSTSPSLKQAIYNTMLQHMTTSWFQKIMCGE